MAGLNDFIERIRVGVGDRLNAMRPNYPPVALEMNPEGIVLVRLKRRGRGNPHLEAHQSRPMPEEFRGATVFRPTLASTDEIAGRVKELFEATGTKPGRVSLVLPDNLAKISLLHLPDRPGNRKQLDEVVRFKLRRAVPFRLDDAILSYQVMPGQGRAIDILVVVLRRFVVEQFESIVSRAGARVGLVDLCTTNLLNLSRDRIVELAAAGGDVAVFNVARGYFSLVLVRGGRIIFYRCKSIPAPVEVEDTSAPDEAPDAFAREVQNSLAYYQEKLDGTRIGAALVRAVGRDEDAVSRRLMAFDIPVVERIDPARRLGLPDGVRLEPDVATRLAPAVGAAVGRAG